MKKIYLLISATLILFSSCVDEYQDANPPRLLDAPAISSIDASKTTLLTNESVEISINVSDAPGGIDSVSATATDDAGNAYGTFTSTNLSTVKGATSGTITMTYMAPAGYSGDLTVSVIVYDRQLDHRGEMVRKSSTAATVELTILCDAKEDYSGTYTLSAYGNLGDGEGGAADTYTDLESTVSVTKDGVGNFVVSDITFGVYPVVYEDDAPEGTITICDTTITDNGDTDQYGDPITINGNVNEDGTIALEWSNTYGDSGTVVLTPQN